MDSNAWARASSAQLRVTVRGHVVVSEGSTMAASGHRDCPCTARRPVECCCETVELMLLRGQAWTLNSVMR
eukprot:52816-Eustigmatos_ZCMA.PRE.1